MFTFHSEEPQLLRWPVYLCAQRNIRTVVLSVPREGCKKQPASLVLLHPEPSVEQDSTVEMHMTHAS